MTRFFRHLFAILVLFVPGAAHGSSFASLRSSVFKINTTSQEPNMTDPWKKMPTASSSGTGFYIGKNRILTNAHVVANASFVTVQRDGDPRPVPATVRFIGHDCDLALLEPVDHKATDDLTPMTFGSLPKLRTPVSVMGYPMGGEQLSVTEGVVSRVSYRRYVHHGYAKHLLVQVDSAINPGNSGGPVVQGKFVVGVAFQTYTQAENTGYIIPTPVVRRFLKDIEDGSYQGHPDDGLTTNDWTMMNPSTEAFHNVGVAGGVKIAHVAHWAPTAKLLEPGDIIVELDDQPVGVDGKVSFEGERVDFRVIFDLKLMGDRARFKIVRNGQPMTVSVPVKAALRHHSPDNVYAKHSKYYVWGGLVFTTLSRTFLRTWGERWYKDAPLLLRFLDSYARFEPGFEDVQDIIVLTKRLPDAINAYATGNIYGVVTEVDGKKVNALEDLIAGLEGGKSEFAIIKFFGSDDPTILSRAKVTARNAALNAKYGVNPDRWLKGAEDDGAIIGMEKH